ncbi:MAG: hypothetical protein J4F46_10565, partial [Dehalococcoidia bacterium]|nr:hypothetical protein [Dehalococcoidia bacterium]
ETRRFRDIVASLPESILSVDSVESERERERAARDEAADSVDDQDGITDEGTAEFPDVVNGCYRILKNNEIMGQILRSKYGTITRDKIEEIIKIVADGGLRLVNSAVKVI